MKTKFFLLATLLLINSMAFASKDRGGGDLCENRIQTIRNDIEDWVAQGGHYDLKFSKSNAEQYAQRMTNAFAMTKIQCVSEGDSGFPIVVDGTPKECIFIKGKKGVATIKCDRKKFEARSEADQYQLIHHEYAGIGGLENPNGDISDYELSRQISSYLESTVVKRLAVKKISGDKIWESVTDSKRLRHILSVRFNLLDNDFKNCQVEKLVQYASTQEQIDEYGTEKPLFTQINIKPNDSSLIPIYRIDTAYGTDPTAYYKSESRTDYFLSRNASDKIIKSLHRKISLGNFKTKNTVNSYAELQFRISQDEKRIESIGVKVWRTDVADKGTLLSPLYVEATTLIAEYECR